MLLNWNTSKNSSSKKDVFFNDRNFFIQSKDIRKFINYIFSDIPHYMRRRIVDSRSSDSQCSSPLALPLVYSDLHENILSQSKHSRNSSFLIPHILHQTWKTTAIPAAFVRFVRRWQQVLGIERSTKPTAVVSSDQSSDSWLHVLWTDAAAREFVSRYYPELLDVYDNARFGVIRADIFRLLVLHRFGGAYADIDVEPERDPSALLSRHACLFASEPAVHAFSVKARALLASNFVAACAPGHPLLEYLVLKLPELMLATRDDEDKIVYKAGPEAIDAALRAYAAFGAQLVRVAAPSAPRQRERAPYCPAHTVFVPSGAYFSPTHEAREHPQHARVRCAELLDVRADAPVQEALAALERRRPQLRDWAFALCSRLLRTPLPSDRTQVERSASQSQDAALFDADSPTHVQVQPFSRHHWRATYRSDREWSVRQQVLHDLEAGGGRNEAATADVARLGLRVELYSQQLDAILSERALAARRAAAAALHPEFVDRDLRAQLERSVNAHAFSDDSPLSSQNDIL